MRIMREFKLIDIARARPQGYPYPGGASPNVFLPTPAKHDKDRWQCPRCGTYNPINNKKCAHCGAYVTSDKK